MAEGRISVVQVGVQGPPGAGIGSHEDESETLTHVRQVTSTTRPSSPIEGQVIYETDTDLYKFWTGSAWRDLPVGLRAAAAMAFTSSNRSVVDNTPVKVNTDTEESDSLGIMSSGTVTIPAGYENTLWLIIGGLQWQDQGAPGAGDFREAQIRINGGVAAQNQVQPVSGDVTIHQVSLIKKLTAADTIELWANQESGAGATLDGGADDHTYFHVACLGRA